MSQISPILLQTQVTVHPGGETGIADSTKLESPFQGPMWLDEIRIRFPATSGVTPQAPAPWSSFKISLRLNNVPLTNGFVPLGLLGKVLNDSTQSTAGATTTPFLFTWKLPKPLFIPAREYLRPTLYFDSYVGAPNPVVVTLLYACRPLAAGTPTPTRIQLPWVTYYTPPAITFQPDGLGQDREDQSQPSDIYNPWNQDFHVQRFVGRLMLQQQNTSNAYELQGFPTLANERVNLNTGIPEVATYVSAQDSFNNILIRDSTPFGHVFDFIDRAWTVNAVLPPKGFYVFNVDRLWSAYENPGGSPLLATVGISMVGWRDVHYVG